MLNKLLNSISINSLVTVYDLLFTHPILRKNIELKDKYKKNQRLFILGSGNSILHYDLKVLKNEYVMTQNSFYMHNDISKIELGMSRDDVATTLGEPILILADTEYDNTINIFYNYHIKRFKLDGGSVNSDSRVSGGERATLLKFTFVDGSLSSWEEEKITLSMSASNDVSTGSLMKYFSLFVNLIILIKIF